MPWYIPVAWLISAAAVAVAIVAYRRAHLTIVRVNRIYGPPFLVEDAPQDERFLRIDFEALGVDIYDPVVAFEIYYDFDVWDFESALRQDGLKVETPPGAEMKYAWTLQIPFHSVDGALPNPLKKRQQITMMFERRQLQEHYNWHPELPKVCAMPPRAVSIVIASAKGKTVLKKIPSSKFRRLLEWFDAP